MYLVDTNVLLEYPSVLRTYQGEIRVTLSVVKELDELKRSLNAETAYNARRAIHKLKRDETVNYCPEVIKKIVDDDLLAIAQKEGDILITNDLNIHIKGKALGVECIFYDKVETNYTGVRYLEVECDENIYNIDLEVLLQSREPLEGMKENEFLIITDKNSGNLMSTMKVKNGKLELIKETQIKNRFINAIFPRNQEQSCLFDLLWDKDISIILATGEFGTGKSFILTNFAFSQLEKGRINKIVYVPNNSIVENSRELGILPGDTIDKELVYMGPLLDLIGQDYTRGYIEDGKIEVVPLSVMRGRSFENSIVIVNEAQNLTTEHVKLLVARCGEGTRIFFDGDIKQTDNLIFKNKNGLKLLLHLADSEEFAPIFGTVRLNSIERSKTAQASAYLDNLLI